jgi:hypothetical protein
MRWLIVEDALRDRKGHWLEDGEACGRWRPGEIRFALISRTSKD